MLEGEGDLLRMTNKRLEEIAGSLTNGLMMLSHALPDGSGGGQRIPRSKTERRGTLDKEPLKAVRALLEEYQHSEEEMVDYEVYVSGNSLLQTAEAREISDSGQKVNYCELNEVLLQACEYAIRGAH